MENHRVKRIDNRNLVIQKHNGERWVTRKFILMEKYTELALRTWYNEDSPLHLNPHHPLGKLLGEWGELLDDYMKSIYKPDYIFDPIDELGDIWYYIRILNYQSGKELRTIYMPGSIDYLMAMAINLVSGEFKSLIDTGSYNFSSVNTISYTVLLEICKEYNITLDQLTDHNWNKLKPGSKRGKEWEGA